MWMLFLACNVEPPTYEEAGCDQRALFYADTDGDGAGDAAVSYLGCEAPTGYVSDASDCDDADPTVTTGCGGDDDTGSPEDTSEPKDTSAPKDTGGGEDTARPKGGDDTGLPDDPKDGDEDGRP